MIKFQFFSLIVVVLLNNIPLGLTNKNHGSTKYDRTYNHCRINKCNDISFDDDCIFRCMSSFCYSQVFFNYVLELGELNLDLKNKFEACFITLRDVNL